MWCKDLVNLMTAVRDPPSISNNQINLFDMIEYSFYLYCLMTRQIFGNKNAIDSILNLLHTCYCQDTRSLRIFTHVYHGDTFAKLLIKSPPILPRIWCIRYYERCYM